MAPSQHMLHLPPRVARLAEFEPALSCFRWKWHLDLQSTGQHKADGTVWLQVAWICGQVSGSSSDMCKNCLYHSLQEPATSSCPSARLTLNSSCGLAPPDSFQHITHLSLVLLPAPDSSHQVLPLSLFSWPPFVYPSFTSSFLSFSEPQSRSVSFMKPFPGSALNVLPSQSSSRVYF